MTATIHTLPTHEVVRGIWDEYSAVLLRLQRDNSLRFDKEFMDNLNRLEPLWLAAFRGWHSPHD